MPITTHHKFLSIYPIKETSTRLIIGTIHPHLVSNFKFDFFYGNIGSFWDILAKAFPNQTFGDLNQIRETINSYNVSITDMIMQCDRSDEFTVADSSLYNIIDNGKQIYDGIVNSKIDTVYFTSRFGKNNAAKLFVDRFNINYMLNFNNQKSEFIIDKEVFGRQIRAIVLYSPSNNANIGISNSAAFKIKIDYYKKFDHPVKQFKIDFYREKFDFFNN